MLQHKAGVGSCPLCFTPQQVSAMVSVTAQSVLGQRHITPETQRKGKTGGSQPEGNGTPGRMSRGKGRSASKATVLDLQGGSLGQKTHS